MKYEITTLTGKEDFYTRLEYAKNFKTHPDVLETLGKYDQIEVVKHEVYFNPSAKEETKKEIIKSLGSNFLVDRKRYKTLYIDKNITFEELLKYATSNDTHPRVLSEIIEGKDKNLLEEIYFNENSTEDQKQQIIDILGEDVISERIKFPYTSLDGTEDLNARLEYAKSPKSHPKLLDVFIEHESEEIVVQETYYNPNITEVQKEKIVAKLGLDFIENRGKYNVNYLLGTEDLETLIEYAKSSQTHPRIIDIFIEEKNEIILEQIFYNNNTIDDEIKIKIVDLLGNDFLINKNKFTIRYLTGKESFETKLSFANSNYTHPRVLTELAKKEIQFDLLVAIYKNPNITKETRNIILNKINIKDIIDNVKEQFSKINPKLENVKNYCNNNIDIVLTSMPRFVEESYKYNKENLFGILEKDFDVKYFVQSWKTNLYNKNLLQKIYSTKNIVLEDQLFKFKKLHNEIVNYNNSNNTNLKTICNCESYKMLFSNTKKDLELFCKFFGNIISNQSISKKIPKTSGIVFRLRHDLILNTEYIENLKYSLNFLDPKSLYFSTPHLTSSDIIIDDRYFLCSRLLYNSIFDNIDRTVYDFCTKDILSWLSAHYAVHPDHEIYFYLLKKLDCNLKILPNMDYDSAIIVRNTFSNDLHLSWDKLYKNFMQYQKKLQK